MKREEFWTKWRNLQMTKANRWAEIDRLTKELDGNLSAYLIARKAMKWDGYAADRAQLSRRLMALDHSIMKLSKLIPDEYVGEETPQEYAAPVAVILRAEHAMLGAE